MPCIDCLVTAASEKARWRLAAPGLPEMQFVLLGVLGLVKSSLQNRISSKYLFPYQSPLDTCCRGSEPKEDQYVSG